MSDLHKVEKTFLVGITSPNQKKWEASESLEELKSLCRTAGCLEVGSLMAEIRDFTPATFVGQGKLAEIKLRVDNTGAQLVIFDGELSPSQNRNIQEALNCRVVDRTSLILDIFALHAKSSEGKLQVELAQYEYIYPRLKGAWTHLSKQRGGGVGLRGPGETQLEVDRRRVRERLVRMKSALKKLTRSRKVHRQKRESVPVPLVTLVGYTNAGKSTVFNYLTRSSQLALDKLFATLDPKAKKLILPSGRQIVLSDTVGFIRNLPHQLIEAFKSTFEEVRRSDLLLHVIDGSHPYCRHQVAIVEAVLAELHMDGIPMISVINKIDRPEFVFSGNGERTIAVSAVQGTHMDALVALVEGLLSQTLPLVRLLIPHSCGSHLANLYNLGRVIHIEGADDGMLVEVMLPEKWRRKYEEFQVGGTGPPMVHFR